MSRNLLILGKSGCGKSSSIKTLDPKSTFLINVIGKDLPFKGATKSYSEIVEGKGNKFTTDDYLKIDKTLTYIDAQRKDIKNIIIDDSQYLIVNEFMKRHSTSGKGNAIFTLYNELADNFWKLIFNSKLLRNDLTIVFLHHSETTETGETKAKLIGKMLDEKVEICGMFTIVLNAIKDEAGYWFETNTLGNSPVKSPEGMFAEKKISNDLNLTINTINKYYEGE